MSNTGIKVTLNKAVMVQHLIVKSQLSPDKAAEVVDLLTQLQHDTLMREGKVIWKNVGTLFLKVAPAKWITSFGKRKKIPTRYKLRFTQSRNFEITKSPLKSLNMQDEVNSLSKLRFDD